MPAKNLFIPQVHNNEHLLRIADHFGDITARPANIPHDVRFVFLAFTNRSGSNYLAELLASSKYLRIARENLNFDTVIDHAKRQSLPTFQDYFSFLVMHTTHNGVVSLKVAPSHLEVLGKAGILDQIIDRSRFVVIERADKLAQAISHLIAFQTGKFMSTMNTPSSPVAPVFDREKLDKILSTIAEEYRDFSLFFGRNGIVPAQVSYEQMVRDPALTLSFVSDMIGFSGLEIRPDNVRLDRQASRLNEEWRLKYLKNEPCPSTAQEL